MATSRMLTELLGVMDTPIWRLVTIRSQNRFIETDHSRV